MVEYHAFLWVEVEARFEEQCSDSGWTNNTCRPSVSIKVSSGSVLLLKCEVCVGPKLRSFITPAALFLDMGAQQIKLLSDFDDLRGNCSGTTMLLCGVLRTSRERRQIFDTFTFYFSPLHMVSSTLRYRSTTMVRQHETKNAQLYLRKSEGNGK